MLKYFILYPALALVYLVGTAMPAVAGDPMDAEPRPVSLVAPALADGMTQEFIETAYVSVARRYAIDQLAFEHRAFRATLASQADVDALIEGFQRYIAMLANLDARLYRLEGGADPNPAGEPPDPPPVADD